MGSMDLTFIPAHHPSLMTLCCASEDPSGGRSPAQNPQIDTPQASKKTHSSIHNHHVIEKYKPRSSYKIPVPAQGRFWLNRFRINPILDQPPK